MAQTHQPQAETLSGSPQPNFAGYAPPPILSKRNPMTLDRGYPLAQVWLNRILDNYWVLTSVVAGVANWQLLSGGGGVLTLSGDSGIPVIPVLGNISVKGIGGVQTIGVAPGIFDVGETGSVRGVNSTIGVATVTVLTIPIPLNSSISWYVNISGYETTTPAGIGGNMIGVARKAGAGTGALLPGAPIPAQFADAALAAASFTMAIDGLGDNVIVTATGVAGLTIDWAASA